MVRRSACHCRVSLVLAGNLLLPDGKSADEPLFVLTTITVAVLISVLLRTTRKRRLAVALVAVLALAALGTDVTADLLLRSLSVPSPQSGTPDVILVAAGSVVLGATPDLDVLSSETESRVATGVAAWHQHPSARLVMAGTETSDPQLAGRMVSLMRDRAVSSGVPAESILLDARSSNTREHAQRLREMPGITRATRVGVATSFWHMRRAARESAAISIL